MRRLPLQDPLWSDRIVVTGVKCHVLIEAIRNRAACHRAIENAAGDVAIVYHPAMKVAREFALIEHCIGDFSGSSIVQPHGQIAVLGYMEQPVTAALCLIELECAEHDNLDASVDLQRPATLLENMGSLIR